MDSRRVEKRDDGTHVLTAKPGKSSSRYVVATYHDGCSLCDSQKAAMSSFFPRHVASPRCKSGKHAHCACDTCF